MSGRWSDRSAIIEGFAQVLERPVRRSSPSVPYLYLRHFLISGRNGGHLTETRQFFSEFSRVEKQQGVDEAVRAKALEHRNVQGIIAYLRENSLEEHVDFVPGGLLTLFVNPEEYRITREQYVSAKSAGVNVDDIEWLEEAETRLVSNERTTHITLFAYRLGIAIWRVFSCHDFPGEQLVAAEARRCSVQVGQIDWSIRRIQNQSGPHSTYPYTRHCREPHFAERGRSPTILSDHCKRIHQMHLRRSRNQRLRVSSPPSHGWTERYHSNKRSSDSHPRQGHRRRSHHNRWLL